MTKLFSIFKGSTWILYLLPISLYLVSFFFYPIINAIVLSLHPKDVVGLSLANYRRFFTNLKMLRALRFTALDLGIVATALSLLVVIPITYRLRRPFRGVTIFRTITTLPLSYAGIIACSTLVVFLGSSGLPNLILMRWGVAESPVQLVYNYTGVIIASIFQQVPILFLFLLASMAGINPSLEEAAKTLGADEWQVFKRVILPLTLPAILMATLLGYISNFSCFVTALICGDPAVSTRTILIEAWSQAYEHWDWPMSTTITIIAGTAEAIFIILYLKLQKKMLRGVGHV